MQGCAWRCEARRGEPRSGSAWHGLASAFLNVGVGVFGARIGQAVRCAARRGMVGRGGARRGQSGLGDTRLGMARCHFQGE